MSIRSESDSWDLATSVGATATMVAAQRALASDAGLINDPFAASLVRAVGIDVYTRLVNGEIPVDDQTEFDPSRMGRGMAVRTRFYDNFFLDATGSGIRQAVIVAAGLDSRAYRLPWPEGTVVYEVDMPNVIEFKTSTLNKLGAEPTAERRTVPVDLRDDWPAALRAAGFDPQAPSVWSAEGLVVYLPTEAQDALFGNVTALSAPQSQLACEFVPDTTVFNDPHWRSHHDRMSELGFEIDFNDLVYHY
ncbi:MAG TPA: class I SAM-dependent methyltransferase, partial [Acidothermaceae bacterium]